MTSACDTQEVGPASLARPVFFDNGCSLHFAGEATNPSHFSTVHGAIESGWREAENIIKNAKK